MNVICSESNTWDADYFVSIHNNAGGGDGAEVFHTYLGGKSKTLAQNILNEIVKIGQNSRGLMHTITKWIEKKLGLKVNATKTKVTKPSNLKYLGFGFWKAKEGWKARPHQDSVARFKRKLKALTKRSWSVSMDYRIKCLNQVIRGWIDYFRIGSMKTKLIEIDKHLRTRMRIAIAKRGLLSCVDYYLN